MEEMENEVVEQKKLNKKLPLIILGVVAVLVVVGLILYFTLPWNILLSKNKSTFSKMLSADAKTITDLMSDIEKNEFIKFLSEDSKSAYNLTANFESKDLTFNAQIIADDEFIATKIDNVYDKFVILDPNKLDTLWNNLELYGDNLPNKLVTEKDLLDTISLTKSEQNKLEKALKKYMELILTNVDESNFVLTEDKEFTYKNSAMNADAIEIQLTNLDLIEIERKVLAELKEDDILDIFINKISKMEHFYKNAGYNFDKVNLTKEMIIESIDGYLLNLDEIEASYIEQQIPKEEEPLFIIRYYYKNNIPLKREFSEKYVYNGENVEDMILTVITLDNENEDYYEFTSFAPSDYAVYYETFANTITKENNKTKNNLVYAVTGYMLDMDPETMEYKWMPMSYQQDYLLETEENKVLLKSENNALEIKGDITDNSLNLSVNVPTGEENLTTLKLKFDKETDKTYESIKSQGALDLIQPNEEETKTEFEKIKTNLTNMGLFAL